MSATPRTDAAIELVRPAGSDPLPPYRKYVPVDFARDLERENAALRNEIARLNGQTNWVCKCGGTDCKGQAENAALRADKELLVEALNLAFSIPDMTDAQLAELIGKCRAVIASKEAA